MSGTSAGNKEVNIDKIRETLKKFDKGSNGFVSAAELRHVIDNLDVKLPDKDADELIREAETHVNKDGKIDIDDIAIVIGNKKKSGKANKKKSDKPNKKKSDKPKQKDMVYWGLRAKPLWGYACVRLRKNTVCLLPPPCCYSSDVLVLLLVRCLFPLSVLWIIYGPHA